MKWYLPILFTLSATILRAQPDSPKKHLPENRILNKAEDLYERIINKFEDDYIYFKHKKLGRVLKYKKVPIKNRVPPLGGARKITSKNRCTSVDLSEKSGPVRDQTAGTCYAYAAMELLNFNQPRRYSALFLAQIYGKEIKESKVEEGQKTLQAVSGFNGGDISLALTLALKSGLCPEAFVPSTKALESDYTKLLSYYEKAKKDNLCEVAVADASGADTTGNLIGLRDLFKDISAETFASLYKKSSTPSIFTESLAIESCKGKVIKNVPKGVTPEDVRVTNITFSDDVILEEKRDMMMAHINRALSQNKPVGFAFYTGGLIRQNTDKDNSHGKHASVLLGRKWKEEVRDKTGKVIQEEGCYYLAKNSWGAEWKVPKGLGARSAADKPGYFMMSEKTFLGYAYEANSLD